jgi:hypothetical protein
VKVRRDGVWGGYYLHSNLDRLSHLAKLDAFNRRIVGWAVETSLGSIWRTTHSLSLQQRVLLVSFTTQTRGTSICGQRCENAGVRPSMGSVGDTKAMCDSFWPRSNVSCLKAQFRTRRRPAARSSNPLKDGTSPIRTRRSTTISTRGITRCYSSPTPSNETGSSDQPLAWTDEVAQIPDWLGVERSLAAINHAPGAASIRRGPLQPNYQ